MCVCACARVYVCGGGGSDLPSSQYLEVDLREEDNQTGHPYDIGETDAYRVLGSVSSH